MASKIATNSTGTNRGPNPSNKLFSAVFLTFYSKLVLIYMAGVAMVVTGGVITYQWFVKPAIAAAATASELPEEKLVNPTRSLDPVANLAWIEQIRQAQMREGNVFPEEVPSCIVRS